jgi:sulfur relay (sulfurtransferase) DsrC/TusE family protein
MLKVWDNKARMCFVDEQELSSEFKRIIYPDLMRLNHEFNNIICMVKEFYSGFSTDPKMVPKIKATDELMASKLALEIHGLLKKKIEETTKLKEDLRTEIKALVDDKAKKIDANLQKYIRDLKEDKVDSAAISSYCETSKRATKCTFDYNISAEERRGVVLIDQLKTFFNKPELMMTISQTQQTQSRTTVEDSRRPSTPSSHSSGDGNRAIITWTSEPIESLPTENSTVDQTNLDETSRIGQIIEPELTEEQLKEIIEKTKFEQVEQLNLENFPANNYIYCIEPATGDPNSFDVGTYGMIILFLARVTPEVLDL